MENKNKIINQFTLKIDKDFLISLNLIKKMGNKSLNFEITNKFLNVIKFSDDNVSLITFKKEINNNINKDTFYFELNFNLFYTIMKTYKIGTELNFKFDELNNLFINEYKLKILFTDNSFFNSNKLSLNNIEKEKDKIKISLNKIQMKDILNFCKISKLKKLEYLKFVIDINNLKTSNLEILNKEKDILKIGNLKKLDTSKSYYNLKFIQKYFIEFSKFNKIEIQLKGGYPLIIRYKSLILIFANMGIGEEF